MNHLGMPLQLHFIFFPKRLPDKENDIYNNPVQGIYHYQVIRRMMDICEKYNLDYEVEEIFAAQNRNKTQPGVSILPQVEQTHGEKAVEAHILRRIFATIRIKDWETDELTTTLVIAYHQDGIQAAIGPCVLICHNQCILSPERSVCNYGKKKVSTEEVFETVDGWLANFEVSCILTIFANLRFYFSLGFLNHLFDSGRHVS